MRFSLLDPPISLIVLASLLGFWAAAQLSVAAAPALVGAFFPVHLLPLRTSLPARSQDRESTQDAPPSRREISAVDLLLPSPSSVLLPRRRRMTPPAKSVRKTRRRGSAQRRGSPVKGAVVFGGCGRTGRHNQSARRSSVFSSASYCQPGLKNGQRPWLGSSTMYVRSVSRLFWVVFGATGSGRQIFPSAET